MLNEGYYPLEELNGFLIRKLPIEISKITQNITDNIQRDFSKATPYNKILAGQIDKEYQITLPSKVIQFIIQGVREFDRTNPQYINQLLDYFSNPQPSFIYEGNAWVNFQEKHEYNPIHDHNGVFSFVIWHKIPFYFKEEYLYGAGKYGKEDNCMNGKFCFIQSNNKGGATTIPLPIDKTMEGCMAIFPSKLQHIVYPFYSSDEYRITISGNIFLKS